MLMEIQYLSLSLVLSLLFASIILYSPCIPSPVDKLVSY